MRGNMTATAAGAGAGAANTNNNHPMTMTGMGTSNTTGNPNPGWFVGAPLTRFGLYMIWISFLCLELNGWHNDVSVDSNAIFQNYQWYRWIFGQLTFASLGETIVGCLWITHMSRRFEREMGSRKFLVWWLGGVGIMSLLLHLVYSQVVVMDSSSSNSSSSLHYSGPYPLVGALLLLFHIYTPRLHPKFVGCCGMMYFSEKSLGYLFCAQIVFYHGSTSIIPCFLGAMASLWMVTWGFHFWEDIPSWIVQLPWIRFLSRYMALDSPASMVMIPRIPPTGVAGRQQQNMPYFDIPTPSLQLPPPDEESIQQLTILGFERDAVVRALRQSHNNIERAADWLLSGNGT